MTANTKKLELPHSMIEGGLIEQELQCLFYILGRHIGSYTGWDQADTFAIQIYDFVPLEGLNLPATECLTFDFETGIMYWYEFKNKIQQDFLPFLPLIAHLPITFKD